MCINPPYISFSDKIKQSYLFTIISDFRKYAIEQFPEKRRQILNILAKTCEVFLCHGKLRPMTKKQPGISNRNRTVQKLGYKDSNLEMTESESVALPFGDSPIPYKIVKPVSENRISWATRIRTLK